MIFEVQDAWEDWMQDPFAAPQDINYEEVPGDVFEPLIRSLRKKIESIF